MTPDEQTIAICALLNWTYDDKAVFFAKDDDILGFDWPSLDACHEFEKTLNDKQRENYYNRLAIIVNPKIGYSYDMVVKDCISATAAQKCEAFLRTKGKWKETP